MNEQLKILNLEDSRRDAELNLELLEASGLSCHLVRVDTRESFVDAMAGGGIDLVLADYRLPGFDGLAALELVREKWPEVPFIFVTGSLGEEVVIETLMSGATDYVLKQNPARLPQAVSRAVREARERREYRATQDALREQDAKFRQLSENLKEMIYSLDPAGLRPVYVNRAVETIYGYNSGEWCRDPGLRERAIHPDDRTRVMSHFTDPEKMRTGGTLEYRIVKKDGTVRWVEDNYSVERSPDGPVVSINGVLYDTTERKAAQEALWREKVELGVATRELLASDEELREYLAKLYQSEEKYRKLMQSANDAIFIADAETGIIIDANQQAGRLLAMPLDQIKGMHQSQLHPPEEAGHYQRIFREHLESGRAVTQDIYAWRSDGTRVPVEISSTIIELDGRRVNQGVFRDITERKRAEEALKKSEEFVQSIIRHSPVAIAVRDKKGRLLSHNPAWIRIWGMTEERIARHTTEIRGAPFRQLFDHLGPHLDEVERLFENGGSLFIPELEIVRPNPGGARWVWQYFYTISDPLGGVDRIIILTDDITERKEAEESLRKSEAFSKSVISQLPAGITVRTAQGELVLYNEAWKTIWQLTEDDIANNEQLFKDRSFNERYPFLVKRYPEAERDFHAGKSFVVPEVETGSADPGAAKWISLFFYSLRDKNGRVDKMVTVTMDISERKLAEQQLHESEQRYRTIVDLSPDAVVIHRQGKVLFANPSCLRMLGAGGLEEVVGKNLLDYVHPDYHRLVAQRVKAMTGENRRVPLVEEKFLRTDGSPVDVEVAAGPVTWEGAPAIQVAFRDITERKQIEEALRESESRNRAILKAIPDLMFLLDRNGVFVDYHASNQGLLLQRPEEFLGKNISQVMPPEVVKAYRASAAQALDNGATRTFEYSLPLPGKVTYFEASVVACGRDRVLTIIRDVTAHKKAEKELEDANRGLQASEEELRTADQELRHNIVELEKSRNELLLSEEKYRRLNGVLEQRVLERTSQLESAMKELEAFSYSVSHDLRAPLRHLAGFVDLLQEKAAGLDKKSRHYLEVISDSSLQMGRLIDGILSFSRLNRAEMVHTRVSLKVLVRRALEILEPELKGREIALKIGELPDVSGDPQLLETVVTNLVSNAVKFTSKKPGAVIEVGSGPDTPEEHVIFVRDNGAGFDMRYADKLFKLFQRQHREEDFQGIGVGLANVGRIVTRHGGRVWAEGAVDQGATFYFSLPRKKKA